MRKRFNSLAPAQELAVVYSSKSISLRLFLRVASKRYAYTAVD